MSLPHILSANLLPGRPWPLGTHFDGKGINFAVVSAHASAMELCLFSTDGSVELTRVALPAHSNDVWHGYLPGAQPGLVYGLRAHGPWQPNLGFKFNANKLLLDPCARFIVGEFEWRDEHFAHRRDDAQAIDPRDNGPWALKAMVIDTLSPLNTATHRPPVVGFSWDGDHSPYTPLEETVLYELHVKGFSKSNPLIPELLRGTFAGLAHPASIAHLKRLDITAVNLLPVHYALDEERLVKMGLSNYWGYNTLGFFCLNPRLVSALSTDRPHDEFREMVKSLHRAKIEVLLDVVYNHTAESDHHGPSLSFRGLDNTSYYRLSQHDRGHYENHAGCGNTLDIRQPRVLQLVLDSLRYWVEDMHVDGFRFDLASVLGREDHGFNQSSAFFLALAQDPVLSRIKLIAEPWDIGPGGYQVGNFPRGWLEWNDHFRDSMRRFWLHQDRPHTTRGDFAMRLCASADLYQKRDRAPSTSVNYVVSHDGFTLRDLVSFDARHNLANGEDNRDGHGHNLSFNAGIEGPTSNHEVNALRAQLQRTLIACTLLSQGTPMISAGDELGHSQGGNNNPYCQDNDTTWIAWERADEDLIRFTAEVLAIRKQWMPFACTWHTGQSEAGSQADLTWFKPDGQPLTALDWQDQQAFALGCFIQKKTKDTGHVFALLFNPEHHAQSFNLPQGQWEVLLNSDRKAGSGSTMVNAHTLVLLKHTATV